MPLRAPAGYMVLMSGRSRLELLNISVALAINVAACFLLIPQYGCGRCGSSQSGGQLCHKSDASRPGLVFMRMHAYYRGYLKPALAGAAAAVVADQAGRFMDASSGPAPVIALASMMLLVFLAGILLLGIDAEDKAVLSLVKARLGRNGTT